MTVFMAIHRKVVQIFQSGPKRWTDRQTDIAVYKAMSGAWLKIRLRLLFMSASFTTALQLPTCEHEEECCMAFAPGESVAKRNKSFQTNV